ncbi:MAG: monofunctional biosynthetic peptidoglycan transglycosylase [Deltaproteobacteria bacterium]|nr:monofunctional biosynthetic peptidoglycan transglycosylase [Deltaproteobacteria bacterium]PWB64229.1 MAG: monofunctional biosynthetic peptidoglycan transglycosylase [Deltaproteobacteria bacterium]
MRAPRRLRKIALAGVVLVAAYAGWIGISLLFLPPVASLANPRASLVITVKDWNRKDHPFVLGPRNRFWTPISAVPPSLKKAVVAAEDANFYVHEGVDYEAMREAIKTDLQKGKFVRGGSTITQQVAKNVFLSREKTITRKIKELILARRLDDTLSKSRILELYLNAVELGPMIYGVGRASHYYFGKPPSALTVRESAFLASMLPGPKVYNPYRKLNRVMMRSSRILRRMYAARMITEEQYRAALAETPNISGLERKVETTMAAPPPEEKAPVPLAGSEPVILESPPGKEAGPEAPGEPPPSGTDGMPQGVEPGAPVEPAR